MVSTRPFPSGSRRDRAQLVLVGSIAIALIIIGLVVVINTVLFTENVATSEAIARSGSAAKFDFQARRDTRSLILRVNHAGRKLDETRLKANVARNVTLFSHYLLSSYSDDDPVWVNVSYHNGSSTIGQRLVTGVDREFTAPDGSANWRPVTDDADVDIGRFVVNLNVSETRQEPFSINVSNATEYVNYTIRAENPGASSDISVNHQRRSGGATVNCDQSAGRVLLDLRAGESFTGDCTFPGFDPLEPPYNVTITNGTNGYGKFGLVANATIDEFRIDPHTGGTLKPYDPCVSTPDVPCRAPAIWAANVTIRYESRTINYTQRQNLSIYP